MPTETSRLSESPSECSAYLRARFRRRTLYSDAASRLTAFFASTGGRRESRREAEFASLTSSNFGVLALKIRCLREMRCPGLLSNPLRAAVIPGVGRLALLHQFFPSSSLLRAPSASSLLDQIRSVSSLVAHRGQGSSRRDGSVQN